jgi:DNA-binding response OmpR family regulator
MSKRILFVEDEPGLVMTLTDRLRSEGYLVETAIDGEVGLARAASESFDAIILDIMLPRKNGFDICRDLRQRDIHTPIIILTARGQVVELSALEFRLLRYFIEHRSATLSRDTLLNDVWSYNALVSTRTVDVHVAWLRQKLEANPHHPQFVLTVHGIGYKFVG